MQSLRERLISHRGHSVAEPENTLRSFARAETLGASWVECDVHQTKDGELVVIHDADISITTTGNGFVAEQTLESLRAVFCRNPDKSKSEEKIQTLEELLNALAPTTKIIIELKGVGSGVALAQHLIAREQRDREVLTRVWVSSFKKNELQQFHALCPSVPFAVTIWGTPSSEELALYASWGASAIHIDHNDDDVTETLIRAIHGLKMEIHVYTVNTKTLGERLLKVGADKLFTDDLTLFLPGHTDSYQQEAEELL